MGLAADIGTLQRFPKITGNDSLARELALTGRKFDAQEAKDIGFVSDVVQGGRKEVVGEYSIYPSVQAYELDTDATQLEHSIWPRRSRKRAQSL